MKTYRSLRAVQIALRANDITCLSLTQSYLKRISEQQHLNAFLEVYEEEALASAQLVDDKLKLGTAGRLAGMVIGIKDNICYKGHNLSAASKILDGFTIFVNRVITSITPSKWPFQYFAHRILSLFNSINLIRERARSRDKK